MKPILFLMCYLMLTNLPWSIQTLQFGQKNVCRKKHEDQVKLYCCYNHYEYMDMCKECRSGTLSEDGTACKTCTNDTFGYACLLKCTCTDFQICDPVHGCVGSITSNHTFNNTFNTKQLNNNELTSSTQSYTTASTVSLSHATNPDTLIYITVVGGIVIVLLICVVIFQFAYKFVHQPIPIPNRDDEEHNVQLNNNVYDEIQDVPTPENTNARQSYFSVIDNTSSSTSEGSSRNSSDVLNLDVGACLNSYQPLSAECERRVHDYNTCIDITSTERNVLPDQVTSQNKEDDNSYNDTENCNGQQDNICIDGYMIPLQPKLKI